MENQDLCLRNHSSGIPEETPIWIDSSSSESEQNTAETQIVISSDEDEDVDEDEDDENEQNTAETQMVIDSSSSDEDEENQCVICYCQAEINTCCLHHCGQTLSRQTISRKLICPVCRQKVLAIFKLPMVLDED